MLKGSYLSSPPGASRITIGARIRNEGPRGVMRGLNGPQGAAALAIVSDL